MRSWMVAAVLLIPSASLHGLSLNIGWNNPSNATLGLNLLWISSNWGVEVGLGQVSAEVNNRADEEESGSFNLALGGGINGKYFFGGSGSIKPYAQLGIGFGLSGGTHHQSGIGAGAGGIYAGGGIMAGSEAAYLYLSLNTNTDGNWFPQVGVGMGI